MAFFDTSSWTATSKPLPTIPRCGACGLFKKCLSPKMESTGRGKHKILFVGEAPGETEDKLGRQFVGKAGECLHRLCDEAGVDLDDCWLTNSVICRPPSNKIEYEYIEHCRPNLTNTIFKLKPKVVVLLGQSAVESLLAYDWTRDIKGIGRWVGWSIPSQRFNCWVAPTYHPSYVMRTDEDPALWKIVVGHIKKAVELERTPLVYQDLSVLTKQIEVCENARETESRLGHFAYYDGVMAFDYETTGLKPEHPDHKIFSVACCLGGENTWAGRIDKLCLPILSKVMRNKALKKIASNLKFEERWTRVKLGHGVTNWLHDTMLAGHFLDNRSDITSVKFQAFVRLGIKNYDNANKVEPFLESDTANGFNRIKEAPLRDVLIYNGLDALVEYLVWQHQMEELKCSR